MPPGKKSHCLPCETQVRNSDDADTPRHTKGTVDCFMKTHEQRGFQVLRKETTTTLEDNTAEPSILSTCHGFRQGIVEEDTMTKLKLATEICSMFHPGDSEPARGCG